MHLESDIFKLVKNGSKDVEIRLNDEKRKKLNIGDNITFCDRNNTSDIVNATIVDLKHFDSFKVLIDSYDIKRLCNCNKRELLSLLHKFYSVDDEANMGVVGIEFKLLD